MAVTVASKLRMLKVYEKFDRIRAASGSSASGTATITYDAPYAVGTNAAVALSDSVVLESVPQGTLDKVTVYSNSRYASPLDFTWAHTTFTAYTSIEEILNATPTAGAYVYLGVRGDTRPKDRHGIGIGTVNATFWEDSLNAYPGAILNEPGFTGSARSSVYEVLKNLNAQDWDYEASMLYLTRVNDTIESGAVYIASCPSVAFTGAASSATAGLRVVYDVSDKGLTYSQPGGRLVIEEIVSSLIEE